MLNEILIFMGHKKQPSIYSIYVLVVKNKKENIWNKKRVVSGDCRLYKKSYNAFFSTKRCEQYPIVLQDNK